MIGQAAGPAAALYFLSFDCECWHLRVPTLTINNTDVPCCRRPPASNIATAYVRTIIGVWNAEVLCSLTVFYLPFHYESCWS